MYAIGNEKDYNDLRDKISSLKKDLQGSDKNDVNLNLNHAVTRNL